MSNVGLTTTELLSYIPQQKPFRFVDEIISINNEKIVGAYTFKQDEFFYAGHFPNNPITPGVILLEAMAQIGVVAFGIYLFSLEVPRNELNKRIAVLTDAHIEVIKPVFPETRVIISAEKVFWRRMKMKSNVEMHDEQGNLLATAVVSGIGVSK